LCLSAYPYNRPVAIYKRGETWWYEFVFSGERIRESTKQGNKRVAEQMAAARRTQLAKGEAAIKDRPTAPTVKEYAKKSFLPHVRAWKGKKPKTLAFYENSVKNLLGFEKLAGARLDQVDVPLIDLYINRRRAVNLQISTINRELATLRRMFNLLADLRPDLAIVLPKVKLQSGENRRDRVVSLEEEKLYLAAAELLLREVALILFDCGLRPEEAYSLKWPYIRNGNVENYEGKTARARRSIPATPRIMEMLERRFAENQGEWIFPAPTKSGHIDHSSLKKQHAAALEASKVETFVIYSLRHTCLTRWAETGMNPYELMRRAGHADLATTMRYIHMTNPKPAESSGEAKEVQGTTKTPHRATFTLLRGGSKNR
jgi:integrase